MEPDQDPTAVVIILALAIYFGIKSIIDYFHKKEVEAHKKELLKGGLVKRRSQRVHKDAMSQLGRQYPNKQLPKRQYYD